MGNLKIITMRDVETERVHFLWAPYIPSGKITIVQGDPGSGKTTMMLAVAAAVTNGDALPGGHGSASASVIFQTAEDGLADTIKPRLEQLGADCSRVHVIDESETALSLADERIEQAIIKTDAKLFILDPLQAYLGGADMHSANGIRPLMKALGAVAERTGCAVVIIGHLNKKGGKAQYRGLGSIDIYAAARSVLTVGKINVDENMRAVVQGKSNLAAPGAPMAFGLDAAGVLTWLGEYEITLDELLAGKSSEHSESRLGQAMRFIKDELAQGEVSAAEMIYRATESGIPKMTLDRAKQTLGVKSVKRQNQWFWTLREGEDIQGIHGENLNILNALPSEREAV
jgi:RecA-family ATPase